jgi:SAM-dependent methyltransferase
MGNRTLRRPNGSTPGPGIDKYYLYTAAVQSVDADISFFRRVYRKERGGPFRTLREDFCGTAVLAREWVRRSPEHRALGVDLDPQPLAWGERHYGPRLGRARDRIRFECADVRDVNGPRVDLVAALNFSYSVFKTRDELGAYFRRVRRSLARDGLFVLDAWGGADTMGADTERRRVPAERAFDGTRVPSFTYVWEQERFNPIDHTMRCHINFTLRDGTRVRRAFSYDWRLWTLPEIRELLAEAGFSSSAVYAEGWDDEEDEPNGIFRRKTYFENIAAWVAYVVAPA